MSDNPRDARRETLAIALARTNEGPIEQRRDVVGDERLTQQNDNAKDHGSYEEEDFKPGTVKMKFGDRWFLLTEMSMDIDTFYGAELTMRWKEIRGM